MHYNLNANIRYFQVHYMLHWHTFSFLNFKINFLSFHGWFHFKNKIPLNCLLIREKWTYILNFGPSRWSAFNMGFVDQQPSRKQGQVLGNRARQQQLMVRIKTLFFLTGLPKVPNRKPWPWHSFPTWPMESWLGHLGPTQMAWTLAPATWKSFEINQPQTYKGSSYYVWWITVSNYSFTPTCVSNIIALNLVKLCSWEYTICSDNKLQHDHNHIITWICSSYLYQQPRFNVVLSCMIFSDHFEALVHRPERAKEQILPTVQIWETWSLQFPLLPIGWGLLCFAFAKEPHLYLLTCT